MTSQPNQQDDLIYPSAKEAVGSYGANLKKSSKIQGNQKPSEDTKLGATNTTIAQELEKQIEKILPCNCGGDNEKWGHTQGCPWPYVPKLAALIQGATTAARQEGLSLERKRHAVDIGIVRQENQEMKNAINTLLSYSEFQIPQRG